MMPRKDRSSKLEAVGAHAVRKSLTPEYINRIAEIVTYRPLGPEALSAILDSQIRELQDHIERRLGAETFQLEVSSRGAEVFAAKGHQRGIRSRELRRCVFSAT